MEEHLVKMVQMVHLASKESLGYLEEEDALERLEFLEEMGRMGCLVHKAGWERQGMRGLLEFQVLKALLEKRETKENRAQLVILVIPERLAYQEEEVGLERPDLLAPEV